MSDPKRETPGRDSLGLAAAISATLGVAGTASAQTSGGLETIVVTATRRAENLQNVPESISAFGTSYGPQANEAALEHTAVELDAYAPPSRRIRHLT